MKMITISYKISDRLAKKLVDKGINFTSVNNQLAIDNYRLKEPIKVRIEPYEQAEQKGRE